MLDADLAACAPYVSPVTLAAIIRVESGGRPLAINVNKGPSLTGHRTYAEAAAAARTWIARGYSVDIGLMQVNSQHLPRLGLSVDQVLEPCTNIRVGATILHSNYQRAVERRGPGQAALMDALSMYNTGSFVRGYSNGYVGKYFNIGSVNFSIKLPMTSAGDLPPDPYTSDIVVYSRRENTDERSDAPAADRGPDVFE